MKPVAIIGLWLCLIVEGLAAPAQPNSPDYLSYQDSLGQYSFGYSGPMSTRSEHKALDGVTRGRYSYIDDSGLVQTIEYEAGQEIGFRIKATNLPETSLPIPETPEVQTARKKHFQLLQEVNRREESSLLPNEGTKLTAGTKYAPEATLEDSKKFEPAILSEIKKTPITIFDTRITSLPEINIKNQSAPDLVSRNAAVPLFDPQNIPLSNSNVNKAAIERPEINRVANVPTLDDYRTGVPVPNFKSTTLTESNIESEPAPVPQSLETVGLVPGIVRGFDTTKDGDSKHMTVSEINRAAASVPDLKNAALQFPDFRIASVPDFDFRSANVPKINPATVAHFAFEVNRAAAPVPMVNRAESILPEINQAASTTSNFRNSASPFPDFNTGGSPSFEFRSLNLPAFDIRHAAQSLHEINRSVPSTPGVERGGLSISEVNRAALPIPEINRATLPAPQIYRLAQPVSGFKNLDFQFPDFTAVDISNFDFRSLKIPTIGPRNAAQYIPYVTRAAPPAPGVGGEGSLLPKLNRATTPIPEINKTVQPAPEVRNGTLSGSGINKDRAPEINRAVQQLPNLRNTALLLPGFNQAALVGFEFGSVSSFNPRSAGQSVSESNKAAGPIAESNRAASTTPELNRAAGTVPSINTETGSVPDFTSYFQFLNFNGAPTFPFDFRSSSISRFDLRTQPGPGAIETNRASSPGPEENRANVQALENTRAAQSVPNFRSALTPNAEINRAAESLPVFKEANLQFSDLRNLSISPFDSGNAGIPAEFLNSLNKSISIPEGDKAAVPTPASKGASEPLSEVKRAAVSDSELVRTRLSIPQDNRASVPISNFKNAAFSVPEINRVAESIPNSRNIAGSVSGFNPAVSDFKNAGIPILDFNSGVFVGSDFKNSALPDLKNTPLPVSDPNSNPVAVSNFKNVPTTAEATKPAVPIPEAKNVPAPPGPAVSVDSVKYGSVLYTPEVLAAREAHFRAYENAARLVAEVDEHPEVLLERLLLGNQVKGARVTPAPSLSAESKRDTSQEASAVTAAAIQNASEETNISQPPARLDATARRIDSPVQAPVPVRKIESNVIQKLQLSDVAKNAVNPKLGSRITPASTTLRVADTRLPPWNEFQQTKLKIGGYSPPIEVSHISPTNILPTHNPSFLGNSAFQFVYL